MMSSKTYLRLVGTLLLLLGVCIVTVASPAPKAKQRFKGIAMDVDNNLALVNTKLVIFLDDDKVTTITTDENGHFDIVLPYGETDNVMRFETRGSFDYNSESIALGNVEVVDEIREVKFGENYRTAKQIQKQKKKTSKLSRKQKKALRGYFKRVKKKDRRKRMVRRQKYMTL